MSDSPVNKFCFDLYQWAEAVIATGREEKRKPMSSEHKQVMVDVATYFEFKNDDGQSIGGPISQADADRLLHVIANPPSDPRRVFLLFEGLDDSHYLVHRRAFDRCSVYATIEPQIWPEPRQEIAFVDETAEEKVDDLDVPWLDVLEGIFIKKEHRNIYDDAESRGFDHVPEQDRWCA